MKSLCLAAAFCFVAVAVARADPATAAVQQKLKDQGFYYGEISGNIDADTTAAIRRYQIRNGLKITGELNAETQKSLGLKGAPPSKSAAPTQDRGGAPAPKSSAAPDAPELHDSSPAAPPRTPTQTQPPPTFQQSAPQPGYPPGRQGLYPSTNGMFNGTPFERAPADVQRRVLLGAQTLLARQGYYRGVIDGEAGPGTTSAVRAYQARFRIAATGRLDMPTLAALGLLPGQAGPGIDTRSRRIYRPPTVAPGPGERLYIPQ